MRTLTFNVDAQVLEPIGDFSNLVPGSSGYLEAEFIFSDEWGGCVKVASFSNNKGEEYPVSLENNKCMIDARALTGRYFKVRVIGAKQRFSIGTTTVKVMQNTE